MMRIMKVYHVPFVEKQRARHKMQRAEYNSKESDGGGLWTAGLETERICNTMQGIPDSLSFPVHLSSAWHSPRLPYRPQQLHELQLPTERLTGRYRQVGREDIYSRTDTPEMLLDYLYTSASENRPRAMMQPSRANMAASAIVWEGIRIARLDPWECASR